MNAERLRAIQAPLKAHYRDNPEAAKLVSHARATLLPDHPACRVQTSVGPVVAGMHPAAGGDGSERCSVDMLLEALVACAGVTFNLVATAMGVPFNSVEVIAQSEGDIRGALGVAKEVPVGMAGVTLRFEVDSPATDAQLALLIQQTERYCVIYQTLRQPPRLEVQVQRVSA